MLVLAWDVPDQKLAFGVVAEFDLFDLEVEAYCRGGVDREGVCPEPFDKRRFADGWVADNEEL